MQCINSKKTYVHKNIFIVRSKGLNNSATSVSMKYLNALPKYGHCFL